MKLSRRSQAAITDLFIAVAVFIVLITITTLIWNLYNVRLEARLDYDTMLLRGYHLVEGFIRSPGYPEDWETWAFPNETTQLFGLAQDDHVLSEAKVARFAALGDPLGSEYQDLKRVMQIALYEYYFVLKTEQGIIVYSAGNIPTGKYTVNLVRLVIFQGQPHILEFAVWKP